MWASETTCAKELNNGWRGKLQGEKEGTGASAVFMETSPHPLRASRPHWSLMLKDWESYAFLSCWEHNIMYAFISSHFQPFSTSSSFPFLPFLHPPRVTRLTALTTVQVVGLDDPLRVLGNAGTFNLSEKKKKINKLGDLWWMTAALLAHFSLAQLSGGKVRDSNTNTGPGQESYTSPWQGNPLEGTQTSTH